jgi:hypothetical protein
MDGGNQTEKVTRMSGLQTMKPILMLIVVVAAVAVCHAEKYCADGPQPTRTEAIYAGRLHTFLLAKGLDNDTHFACGEEHTLFVGRKPMTEALASSLAKSIGLDTAKVSGYSKVRFSEEGGPEDTQELWEYDLKTRKIRHGIQRDKEIEWQ